MYSWAAAISGAISLPGLNLNRKSGGEPAYGLTFPFDAQRWEKIRKIGKGGHLARA